MYLTRPSHCLSGMVQAVYSVRSGMESWPNINDSPVFVEAFLFLDAAGCESRTYASAKTI